MTMVVITGKAGNETRQVRTHTRAPGTSPKLKSLQDFSIRVNPEVIEKVMCKVIHPMLESSDPFHRAFSLVNRITDVPLQRGVPVGVPGRGGGSDSEPMLRVTVRGVVTTTLMVIRVVTQLPSVPLGLLRVSLWCSRGLLCCLHTSSPARARWSCEAMARLSHLIKLQCKTFTRVQSKAWAR
jgi:hypothetical protein